MVDGKIVRRSGLHCAARVRHQHMGLLMFRRKENNMQKCHICRSPPWQLGTRFTFVRQPLAQPSLAFQRSKDCNPRSATPSDVRGKQGIIISHADHGEAALAAFSVEWIARYNLATLPGMSLYVMALLRSRFLHRERTSVLGIQLSRFLQYYCIKAKSWRMLCTIS